MLYRATETFAFNDHLTEATPHAVAPVFIDGTHSSGKSTVIKDYIAIKELISDDDCNFGASKDPITPYPFVCVIETIDGLQVPIVIVSEAATNFARLHPSRRMLTDEYNRLDQLAISHNVLSNIEMGAIMAAGMARKMQPESDTTISAVVSDRGPLAGYAYADLRLPGENHDTVNVQDLVRAHEGFFMANPSDETTYEIGLESMWLSKRAARVFLASADGIAWEDNGLREADLSFRDDVAQLLHHYYQRFAAQADITHLEGDRAARLATFQAGIGELLTQHLRSL